MRRLLYILCFLPAVGCTKIGWEDVPGANVYASAPYSTAEQSEVWNSEVSNRVSEWNVNLEEIGCIVPFVFTPQQGHAIVLVPESKWEHGKNFGGMTFRDAFGDGGHIDIRGDDPDRHDGALMHELGHAMGLDHADPANGPSVMNRYLGAGVLYPRDLEAAACVLGCGPCDNVNDFGL